MDYRNQFLLGNVMDVLRQLPAESVDCCVTSPPYYGLRTYGGAETVWDAKEGCEHRWGEWSEKHDVREEIEHGKTRTTDRFYGDPSRRFDGQHQKHTAGQFCSLCGAWRGELGLEPTPELYLTHLWGVFDEVWRVMKKTGTMWMNIGDTYGGSQGRSGGKGHEHNGQEVPPRRESQPKCLLAVPERFMLGMIDRGWILRNKIVWHKPNPMPSSSKDRLTNVWEYLYFFVKNASAPIYCYNEKTGVMQDRPPKERVEGEDWEWREVGVVGKDTFNVRVRDAELDRFTQKATENEKKDYGKPKLKKYSFWHSVPYWFDLDAVRESYSDVRPNLDGGSATQSGKPRQPVEPRTKTTSGKNPGDCWRITTQPFSGWVETSRLYRVALDAVSDGMTHIVFPSCPVHGGLFDSIAREFCGEPPSVLMNHNGRKDDDHAQEQEDDSAEADQHHKQNSEPDNLGSSPRQCSPSATDRSKENHKTALSPETSSPCKPFVETLSHIDDRQELLSSFVLHANTHGNSILPDETDARLLDRIPYRIVDKSSLPIPPNCSCLIYKVISKESSHFATFPEELCRRAIKAGCPMEVCPKCGKGRVRLTKTRYETDGRKHRAVANGGKTEMRKTEFGAFHYGYVLNKKTETLGWTSCSCGEGYVPGVNLDPFAGSGTVPAVAWEQGRSFVYIDIKQEYIDMAKKRLADKMRSIPRADDEGQAETIGQEVLKL